MASVRTTFIFLLLAASITALQVSPSSPCSSLCLDNANASPDDPNNSNTYSTDIICNDADYNTTAVGKKFKACVSCLQTSPFSSATESDQSWFLYNLRFATDWCLFGFPKNASPLGGPCLITSSCGGLATALETGNLNPSNGSTYDYCSADGGTFSSDLLGRCTSCLPHQSSATYFANFLIALQAGCNQRPNSGQAIGLDGTIFSSTVVNITAVVNPSNSSNGYSPGLTTGAKIGIAVACVITALIVSGVVFICFKKRKTKRRLQSSYDPRFGATEITAPNRGAYTNPASSNLPSKSKPIPPYEIPIPKHYVPHLPSNGTNYPLEKYTQNPTTTTHAHTPTTTATTVPSPTSASHSPRRGSSSTKFSSNPSSPELSPDFADTFSTAPTARIPVHAAYIPTSGHAVQAVSPTHSTAPRSPPTQFPEPYLTRHNYGRAESTSAASSAANPIGAQTAARGTSMSGSARDFRSFPERMRSTRTGILGWKKEENKEGEAEEEDRDSRYVEQWPGSY